MPESRVGVLGATSIVGHYLLPILNQAGFEVLAFSRHVPGSSAEGVAWQSVHDNSWVSIELWVCLAPIWVLPQYVERLQQSGIRRIVVLSSTSRFTKSDSPDHAERELSRRLQDGERWLQTWAEAHDVDWVILRPTLIYGGGKDGNISEITRFVSRFGFFPLLGTATGLRQPVHAQDVAAACVAALTANDTNSRAYNLSGADTLPYREMVTRVFTALGRRPRFVVMPRVVFQLLLGGLRILPRYRHWSVGMAERMNRDMVFDHADAVRELGFSPRRFELGVDELP